MLTILRSDLENENDAIQKQIRDYYARIYDQDIRDSKYIKDTSLEFCKKQKLKEAMLKSVEFYRILRLTRLPRPSMML